MAYVIIRHKVKDFTTWKTQFDEHGTARAKAGCKGGKLFRAASDPNDLVILCEWDSVDNARKFTQGEDIRAVMNRAGVIGTPEIHFLDRAEAFSK